jgi:hypothetical protein
MGVVGFPAGKSTLSRQSPTKNVIRPGALEYWFNKLIFLRIHQL